MIVVSPSVSTLPISRVWFPDAGKNSCAQLRLFCFPYAGGSSLGFQNWKQGLPREIEVAPVHLPNRGNRFREPPYFRMEALMPILEEAITPLLDLPFAFFGHSMGALMAFELARALERSVSRRPEHLFVSGRRAPDLPPNREPLHNMREDKLILEMGQLNGTPPEVLGNEELMRLVLPLLRADCELAESYRYVKGAPLNCEVSAFGGLQDVAIPPEELQGWGQQTQKRFQIQMFPGDHFFLNSAQRSLLQSVQHTLRSSLSLPG